MRINMKLLPAVISLWFCCILVVSVATIAPPSTRGTLRFNTVSWQLSSGTASTPYTTFLTTLRGNFRVADVCGFPVTAKTTTKPNEFILVDITSIEKNTVTLALRTTDAYFVGYRDKINGKDRANFVQDYNEGLDTTRSTLFPTAGKGQRFLLPFESSYASLENAAGSGRQSIDLGITNLNSIIGKVYGKEYIGQTGTIKKDLAKFGIIVVQMVAEAVRFKYIEDEVVKNGVGGNSFRPSADIISLQKEWGKISEAIHVSATVKPSCVTVQKLDFPSNVNTIVGLRTYISLIKFKKNAVSTEEFDVENVLESSVDIAAM